MLICIDATAGPPSFPTGPSGPSGTDISCNRFASRNSWAMYGSAQGSKSTEVGEAILGDEAGMTNSVSKVAAARRTIIGRSDELTSSNATAMPNLSPGAFDNRHFAAIHCRVKVYVFVRKSCRELSTQMQSPIMEIAMAFFSISQDQAGAANLDTDDSTESPL